MSDTPIYDGLADAAKGVPTTRSIEQWNATQRTHSPTAGGLVSGPVRLERIAPEDMSPAVHVRRTVTLGETTGTATIHYPKE
ncbi:hypothetical protein M2390_003239 [Mycetocola sp. BIGb0189]|nr:hypothetical protein [Mycetocola sp. BIGb0189]